MAERTKMKARIQRRPRPPGLDVADGDAVRAYIVRDLSAQFVLSGSLPELARFFSATWEEQVDFREELEEGGREEVVAALFGVLARRPEALRRYREGEVGTLPTPNLRHLGETRACRGLRSYGLHRTRRYAEACGGSGQTISPGGGDAYGFHEKSAFQLQQCRDFSLAKS